MSLWREWRKYGRIKRLLTETANVDETKDDQQVKDEHVRKRELLEDMATTARDDPTLARLVEAGSTTALEAVPLQRQPNPETGESSLAMGR